MIEPIRVDVTKDEDVMKAQKHIEDWLKNKKEEEKKNRYLHCIINNAGAQKSGTVDWSSLPDFQKTMDSKFSLFIVVVFQWIYIIL